jgi:hypothetical protein
MIARVGINSFSSKKKGPVCGDIFAIGDLILKKTCLLLF